MTVPPFVYTPALIGKLSSISFLLGKIQTRGLTLPSPVLRKENTIKTIHSTLAIEGNTLSLAQVTAMLEGKKVRGRSQEIKEVQNTIQLYKKINTFRSIRFEDFKKAHAILMKGLVGDSGQIRNQNVGVLQGERVVHAAPSSKVVHSLVAKLFDWLKHDKETHPLIKSCLVHYEIEFIHPFMDGNGRMGRFWQTLVLKEFDEVFCYLSIESMIKENQDDYYTSLRNSDKKGESSSFIEFMLFVIEESLKELIEKSAGFVSDQDHRLDLAKQKFKKQRFTRKEYVAALGGISTATASRDLKLWVEKGLLNKEGERNQTQYYF